MCSFFTPVHLLLHTLQVVSQLFDAFGFLIGQTEEGASLQVPNVFRPTFPGEPLIIRYSVSDSTGNLAAVVLRKLRLVCPDVSSLIEAVLPQPVV